VALYSCTRFDGHSLTMILVIRASVELNGTAQDFNVLRQKQLFLLKIVSGTEFMCAHRVIH
jgi:hypothetical protein